MIGALLSLAVMVAPLSDPSQEARAAALDAELRCVACQNEPISQSTADIAADMRMLVRERIAAGDSDEQIRGYFARRYGDFVLLRPPFKGETALLWAAPFVLLAVGGALVLLSRRGQKSGANDPEDALDDEL